MVKGISCGGCMLAFLFAPGLGKVYLSICV